MSRRMGPASLKLDLMDTRNPDARVIAKFIRSATGWQNIDARHYFKDVPEEQLLVLLLEARQWEKTVEKEAGDRLSEFMQRNGVKPGIAPKKHAK